MSKGTSPRIIAARDCAHGDAIWALGRQLDLQRFRVKVGKELFTASGPDLVRCLVAHGFPDPVQALKDIQLEIEGAA